MTFVIEFKYNKVLNFCSKLYEDCFDRGTNYYNFNIYKCSKLIAKAENVKYLCINIVFPILIVLLFNCLFIMTTTL